MEMLKVNETPIRTSRNFNINNVRLENIRIPENVEEFKTVKIEKENSIIDNKVSIGKLVYGNGEVLENNILENANSRLKIVSNKNEKVRITYNFDDDNTDLISELEFVVSGDLDVIITYKSSTNKKCFHNGIIKVIAEENAKVNITIVNLLNEKSDHFEAIQNEINNNADIHYTIVDLGGKNSINNYYSDVVGVNAKNTLKTIYIGKEEELKDINYIVHLKGEKSFTDIDVQGALKDKAKKNFKGTIDFKKDSKKAKGNENEYCVLLSDKAISRALPILLCTEEDIEGNHSTASGKIEEDKLFYVMSRGLSYKEAIKLLIKSKFNKILETVQDETLKEQILKEIDRRLD